MIVLVAIVSAVFVYPKWLGAKWQPWHLGLDLVGGSHLVYQIDLSKVSAASQDSVVQGLRDVIEKRINLFGVSEPQVYTAQTGNQAQLIVDLAGIKNVSDAINQIGQTPLLQFPEVDQTPSTTQPYIFTNLTGRIYHGRAIELQPEHGRAGGGDDLQ